MVNERKEMLDKSATLYFGPWYRKSPFFEATLRDDRELLRTAFRTILGRQPSSDEVAELSGWLKRQGERRAACEDLVWALAASAEFRFNH